MAKNKGRNAIKNAGKNRGRKHVQNETLHDTLQQSAQQAAQQAAQQTTQQTAQIQTTHLQNVHKMPESRPDLIHSGDVPRSRQDGSHHYADSRHYSEPSMHDRQMNQRRDPPLHDPVIEGSPTGDAFDESADTATSELGTHLLFCTRSIEKNNETLNRYATALRTSIALRLASEARLTAQSIRLAIGSIWLMIAFLLYMNVNDRGKTGIFTNGLGSQMPAEHAASLSGLFLIVSLPVIILSIVAAVYIWHSTGNNTRIRYAAENLGLHISGIAHQFDDTLDSFLRPRNQGHQEQNLSETAQNLSRAHLTALEVQLFFRQLKFMNAKTRSQAITDLKGFLKNTSPAGPSSFTALVSGIFIGVTGTAIVVLISGDAPTPQVTPTSSLPDILLYPSYCLTLLFGAIVFLLAGTICNLLIPGFRGVRRQALDDALDAARGAYTGDNAPRFHEIIRRIEEALAAYQARIDDIKSTAAKNRTALANQQQNHQTANAGDADLEWRHRNTAARFVDTGFQSIPDPFKDKAAHPGQSRSTSRYQGGKTPEKP